MEAVWEKTMANTRHPYSRPDQQGKFDGLCGVYAILNSIKWLYRIDEDDLDAMFQSLCESLPGKFPQALWNGLGVPEIGPPPAIWLNSTDTMTFTGIFHSFAGHFRQSTRFGDAWGNKSRLMSRLLSSSA